VKAGTRAQLGWAAAAIVIAAGAVAIWLIEAQRTITVVNGLEEKLTVRIGSATTTVGPLAKATLHVRVGGAEVEVKGEGGRLVDRHALLVPSEGGGQALYNPLGAAPVFQENVVYSSGGSTTGPGPNFRPLAGERFVVVHADHVLEDPPKSISVKEKTGYTVRQHVGVLGGGWSSALTMLQDAPAGGYARSVALARRLAAVIPGERAGWWALRGTLVLEGPEAASAAALAVADVGEKGKWAEYALVQAMRRAGRGAELQARYRAQLEKEPGSPAAAMLLARVLPPAEADAVMREALQAHPDDDELLRGVARMELKIGRVREAAARYAKLAAKDPDVHGDPLYLDVLLRTGRLDEALKVALSRATSPQGSARDVARYVRLTRLKNAKPPRKADDVVKDWAKGRAGAYEWLASLLGDKPPGAHGEFSPIDRVNLAIQQAVTEDPGIALSRCRDAEFGSLVQLEDETLVLLAAEAARTGDTAFERLWAVTDLPMSPEAFRGWIDRGEEPPDGWRIDPGERAAVLLARARRLAAAGKADPSATTAAVLADPLIGVATVAGFRWKPPGKATEKATEQVRLVLARPPGS
jgi:hypothetical protein